MKHTKKNIPQYLEQLVFSRYTKKEFEAKKIKVYAENCMPDLITQIYKWNEEGNESIKISITDLLLMANHIKDLELEVYGKDLNTKE